MHNGNNTTPPDDGMNPGRDRSQDWEPKAGGRSGPSPSEYAQLLRTIGEEPESRSRFGIGDYLRLLWRGKWVILACFLVGLLISAYYTLSLPFVYESSLQIMLKDQQEKQEILGQGFYPAWTPPDRIIKKEIQVLRSRPILERTADSLLTRRFIEPAVSDSVIPLIRAAEHKYAAWTDVAKRKHRIRQSLVESIRKVTTAEPSKDADIITITCRTGDNREAALIANVYARVYEHEKEIRGRVNAVKVREFVEKKLDTIGDILNDRTAGLRDYQEQNDVYSPDAEVQDLTAAKTNLDNQIDQTKIQLQSVSQELAGYRSQLGEIDEALGEEMSHGTSPYIMQMQDQVAHKRARLDMLRAMHPTVKSVVAYSRDTTKMRGEIEDLETKLQAAIEQHRRSKLGSIPVETSASGTPDQLGTRNKLMGQIFEAQIKYDALKAQESAINDALAEVNAKLNRAPENARALGVYERDIEGTEKTYQMLVEVRDKKLIEAQSLFADVEILEEARPSSAHISPNRKANVATGSLVGLILGIGIVLLIAYSDTTVHSPDDLEKNNYTVLAAIAPIDDTRVRTGQQPSSNKRKRSGRKSPPKRLEVDSPAPITAGARTSSAATHGAGVGAPPSVTSGVATPAGNTTPPNGAATNGAATNGAATNGASSNGRASNGFNGNGGGSSGGNGNGNTPRVSMNMNAPHLISFTDPKSPIAESYRSLRTALQFAGVEKSVETILVTSSIPQEGKSTTSTNLAIVIAQSGARTLLVDCDLRRPIIHSIFGYGKEPGLVNSLVGGVPLSEAVRPTGITNLDVLCSGSIPPNPSELLGSRRMREAIEELKGMYDMVVLDSPPVSAVTDAVILSTMTDVVVPVVRAHKTKIEFIDKTREDIMRVSDSMLGVVLNDFDATQSYGASYKYYRYYKYYSYYR